MTARKGSSFEPSEAPWVELGPIAFWAAARDFALKRDRRWRDAASDESFWRDAAPNYDDKSPLAEHAAPLVADLRALLPRGGSLLDIGAGTGAFTRRLAEGLSAITCVEPSAAMRAAFVAAWDRSDPVRMLACDWRDAPNDLSADLVLCSNALYREARIAVALEKMAKAAQGHVALVQSVGRPHAAPLSLEYGGRLWERERADCLGDVLHSLGIDHRRRDYRVPRPDGDSRVALLTWRTHCV